MTKIRPVGFFTFFMVKFDLGWLTKRAFDHVRAQLRGLKSEFDNRLYWLMVLVLSLFFAYYGRGWARAIAIVFAILMILRFARYFYVRYKHRADS